MKKSRFSEQDIRTKFILPTIKKTGWDEQNQLREEYSFTDGRIKVRDQMVMRGKAKRADFIPTQHTPNIRAAFCSPQI